MFGYKKEPQPRGLRLSPRFYSKNLQHRTLVNFSCFVDNCSVASLHRFHALSCTYFVKTQVIATLAHFLGDLRVGKLVECTLFVALFTEFTHRCGCGLVGECVHLFRCCRELVVPVLPVLPADVTYTLVRHEQKRTATLQQALHVNRKRITVHFGHNFHAFTIGTQYCRTI